MKPVIVGMNNPISSRPEHALYPHPPGCTGHRLFCLLRGAWPEVTEAEYLVGFERTNLLPGRGWSAGDARRAAPALRRALAGRVVVLLGRPVQKAFGYRGDPLTMMVDLDGTTVYLVPHPSGRNPWYNTAANGVAVGALLAKLLHPSGDV